MFDALKPYYGQLTEAEKRRNLRGDDRLYVSSKNEGYQLLNGLYNQKIDMEAECAVAIQGMRGTVLISESCVSKERFAIQNYKCFAVFLLRLLLQQLVGITSKGFADDLRQHRGHG